MKLIYQILTFTIILKSTNGLQCYVCNSRFNDGCETLSDNQTYLRECSYETAHPVEAHEILSPQVNTVVEDPDQKLSPGNFTFCRKSVTNIDKQNNKGVIRPAETLTIRSCGWIGSTEDVCKWGSSDGSQNLMCTCKLDGCNSSGKLSMFLSSVFGFILVALTVKLID